MAKKWYDDIEQSVINSHNDLLKELEDDNDNYKAIKAVFDLLAKE